MADEGEGGPASKRGTERQGEGRRGTAKDFTSTSCDPHSSTGRGGSPICGPAAPTGDPRSRCCGWPLTHSFSRLKPGLFGPAAVAVFSPSCGRRDRTPPLEGTRERSAGGAAHPSKGSARAAGQGVGLPRPPGTRSPNAKGRRPNERPSRLQRTFPEFRERRGPASACFHSRSRA